MSTLTQAITVFNTAMVSTRLPSEQKILGMLAKDAGLTNTKPNRAKMVGLLNEVRTHLFSK